MSEAEDKARAFLEAEQDYSSDFIETATPLLTRFNEERMPKLVEANATLIAAMREIVALSPTKPLEAGSFAFIAGQAIGIAKRALSDIGEEIYYLPRYRKVGDRFEEAKDNQ